MKNKKRFAFLFKYLKGHKKQMQIAFVLVFIENMLILAAPLVFGKMVDEINVGNFTKLTIALLVLWVMLDIISGWVERIKSRKVAVIAFESSTKLVTKTINHVLRLPLSFHKEKKIGEIVQRISRADQFLYRFIEDGIFYMFPTILSSIVVFFIISFIEWKLALIYLFFVGVHFLITIFYTKPIIHFQKKMNSVFEGIYGDIYDRTPNILNVKSNTSEDIENKRNISGFKKGGVINIKQYTMWLRLGMSQNITINVGLFIFFGLGAYYVSIEKISIGNFTSMLWYITMLSSYIYRLGFYYKNFQEGLVTIDSSEKLFDEKTEDYDNPKSISLKDCKGEIEFREVYFKYDKEDVLKNISFKAEAGKTIAIVGRSGEGKSTLTNLVSRYMKPQKGMILLDGIDIEKIKLSELRSEIAIVPQEVSLFNDTIENNIRYSNIKATQEEIENAAKQANCDEFIQKFPKKYKQIVGERGVKLSVGQKQRIAIARAILRDPSILILDEATSALDSESERLVQDALEKIMNNRTTFVIAHRLSTIRKADLIIVLEDGEICQKGNHSDLILKEGLYKKLSELQRINI